MSKLSFEPKYHVENNNGEWAVKRSVLDNAALLFGSADAERDKIKAEGGVISEFYEGQKIREIGPSSRGAVDAFK